VLICDVDLFLGDDVWLGPRMVWMGSMDVKDLLAILESPVTLRRWLVSRMFIELAALES